MGLPFPGNLSFEFRIYAIGRIGHQFLVAPEFLLLRRRRAIGVSSVTAAPAKASTKLER